MGKKHYWRPLLGERRVVRRFVVYADLPTWEANQEFQCDRRTKRWLEMADIVQKYSQPLPEFSPSWTSVCWAQEAPENASTEQLLSGIVSVVLNPSWAEDDREKEDSPSDDDALNDAALELQYAIRWFFHMWATRDHAETRWSYEKWRQRIIIPWGTPTEHDPKGYDTWPNWTGDGGGFWKRLLDGLWWLLHTWFKVPYDKMPSLAVKAAISWLHPKAEL